MSLRAACTKAHRQAAQRQAQLTHIHRWARRQVGTEAGVTHTLSQVGTEAGVARTHSQVGTEAGVACTRSQVGTEA
eukprot:1138310-Pelagomonas_calceolata.AAC.5